MRVGDQIDRYEVIEPLGAGGTASVFRVRHQTLGSEYALKVLTSDHPDLAERLIEEGRLQSTLQHPNIVTVHDVFDVDGRPAL